MVTISAQAVRPRGPGQWMDPGALGSLGVGTGFAIAAGLANPAKEVLVYYGDGSFGMTAFDMETANRFGVPYLAVIGNNSAMNQIRYGQLAKYGEQRGSVGNLLGDVPFGKFAEMLGGYGEEVRDPAQIAPALQRARESVRKLRRSAVVNIWVDPREYAPGTKNQTMYKILRTCSQARPARSCLHGSAPMSSRSRGRVPAISRESSCATFRTWTACISPC